MVLARWSATLLVAALGCGTVDPNNAPADAVVDGPATLHFGDERWDFGGVSLSRASQAFSTRIVNGAATPVGPISVTISGAHASDFAVDASACAGRTLGTGVDCVLAVTFSPAVAGERSAVLTASAGEQSATMALVGRGLTLGALTIEPLELNVGNVAVGTASAPQPLTLTNTGETAQASPTVRVDGPFEVESAACGTELAAGASCNVTVLFKPLLGGRHAGTLTVESGLTGTTAALSGTGVATLTVSTRGTGTVVGAGVDCGRTCTVTIAQPSLMLTASPTSPADIGGWSIPSCGANPSCEVPITTGVIDVSVRFRYLLQITKNVPTARVASTSPDRTIACGQTCQARYEPDQEVVLQATGTARTDIGQWTGCTTVTDGGYTCRVRMDAHKTVDARFDPI